MTWRRDGANDVIGGVASFWPLLWLLRACASRPQLTSSRFDAVTDLIQWLRAPGPLRMESLFNANGRRAHQSAGEVQFIRHQQG